VFAGQRAGIGSDESGGVHVRTEASAAIQGLANGDEELDLVADR
jgi:hypothetical protein